MFGFLGGSGSLVAGKHDTEKERPAPPLPTPVTFPTFTPPSPSPSPALDSARLFKLFGQIRKPSDVGVKHFTALNISFEPVCDFEDILPTSNDQSSFLPPRSWSEEPPDDAVSETRPATSGNPRLLSNGRPWPTRQDYYIRLKELGIDNEDAYAALSRKPRADRAQKPPRLAHFRRFWEALDGMAYYWDTSLDEYITPRSDGGDEGADGAQQSSSEGAEAAAVPSSDDTPGHPTAPESPRKKARTETTSAVATPVPGLYRGHRVSTGAAMPDADLTSTIHHFLEPIAWPFGFSLAPHRRPPLVAVAALRLPARLPLAGWRPARERDRARAGWLEGPVLGVCARGETGFGQGGEGGDGAGGRGVEAEMLDLLREAGACLCLAQERAREGRAERRAGEGKWWASVPRWGGGRGGEAGETLARESGDEPARAKARGRPAADGPPPTRRKTSAADAWRAVRPGSGCWDPRVAYRAIGTPDDDACDEVFVVSALNHHVSVLKLRVHPLYLAYLADGALPAAPPSDAAWSAPRLQRTRWFDLFDARDRAEAMRGLWGVVGYLARGGEGEV